MSRSFTRDFGVEVQRGNIAGFGAVNKFGRNSEIDSGDIADIWDGGNFGDVSLIWLPPTQARAHTIASTDANDTDGGSGANTVRILGLTAWDADEVFEDVVMDTASPPVTSNAYVIIHRMIVLTWGALGPNIGIITATAASDGTITAQIGIGPPKEGQTQMAVYGIPSTQTAQMKRFYASLNKSSGVGATSGYVDICLCFNPIPDDQLLGYSVKETQGLSLDGNSSFDNSYEIPKTFVGPGILKVQAASGTNNMDVSAGFDLYLIDN